MYQYQGYDLMTGLYILIGLVWLSGLLIGMGLGYRLAWRHIRVQREYAQREPDVQTESKALEAYEANKPLWERQFDEILRNRL